jgi:hypothetical protein
MQIRPRLRGRWRTGAGVTVEESRRSGAIAQLPTAANTSPAWSAWQNGSQRVPTRRLSPGRCGIELVVRKEAS